MYISELDKAIESFRHLQSIDPYRLDNLDTYSNLLYVNDLKTDLANLAHHAVSIDKYRVETCCVIGKYQEYSQVKLLLKYLFYLQVIIIVYVRIIKKLLSIFNVHSS